ncbi:MAG: helix-turn-helix domain-containing protein [Ginsengibacter sp.]
MTTEHNLAIYKMHRTGLPLHDFISHFTYYKNHTPHHSIDRFLPNGNIEIVIDLTQTPKFIYDNTTLTEIQACKELWVSGIRNNYITIPSGLNSEMFIINFNKGKSCPFLGFPLHEITDKVIDGGLVLNKIFLRLRDRLLTCNGIEKKFAIAEEVLTRHFRSALVTNPVIEYAVNRVLAAPEMTAIRNIAARTGYSSKHLIHLFEHHVGVSPKSFLRIIRFQKSILEIERNGYTNFTSLALDCGYYDQSHFIADFKNFSGFTPVEYLKRKNNQLNYVPVR